MLNYMFGNFNELQRGSTPHSSNEQIVYELF